MAAIVTNKFRIANAKNFKEDLTSSSVYVYIAKSDAWSDTWSDTTDAEPPTPNDSHDEEANVHANMIAMKTLSDVSHVIPRYNWNSGTTYVAYDDQDENIFNKQFYVMTDEYKVYKCIDTGRDANGDVVASVVRPTQTEASPQTEGDGYVWKYMYTLQVNDADKFLTNYYIPVKTATSTDTDPGDITQYTVQGEAETATKGRIYRIVVEDGGSGYGTAAGDKPTVTIIGNGSGAEVVAAGITVVGGVVKSIELDDNGTGYSQAEVQITGGSCTGCVARAVVTPANGHGVDPVTELGAFYISTNVKLEYEDGNDIIIDNGFRQVGILKDPTEFGTTTIATDTTLSGLKAMEVSGLTAPNPGEVIVGNTSGAMAFVDRVIESGGAGTVKYHQNEKTGYTPFQDGESISGAGSYSAAGTITSLVDPDYQPYSGDILFIENRDPINRSATQIEDIKIIIEF